MILVVMHHVMLYSFGIDTEIDIFLRTFRQPLFFFVSGFFAFKPLEAWDSKRTKNLVFRKFKVQIFGACIFLSLYTTLIVNCKLDYHIFLLPDNYWFTFALFRIFIWYLIIVVISRLFGYKKKLFWILLLMSSLACVILSLKSTTTSYYEKVIDYLCCYLHSKPCLYQIFQPQAIHYFPYFAIGLFARAKLKWFEFFLSNNTARTVIIIAVISNWLIVDPEYKFYPNSDTTNAWYYFWITYSMRVLSLILVVQVFFTYRQHFDSDSPFSKAIRLIGRRTLDIYFIHYFFLPNLHFLQPSLTGSNQSTLQITIGLTLTMIIVGLSLLVGLVIRTSPLLT